ncbi:unnamed protein product, partial [Amoebophrya sp. A120]
GDVLRRVARAGKNSEILHRFGRAEAVLSPFRTSHPDAVPSDHDRGHAVHPRLPARQGGVAARIPESNAVVGLHRANFALGDPLLRRRAVLQSGRGTSR